MSAFLYRRCLAELRQQQCLVPHFSRSLQGDSWLPWMIRKHPSSNMRWGQLLMRWKSLALLTFGALGEQPWPDFHKYESRQSPDRPTHATALMKLTSNVFWKAARSDSAILFPSPRVPWLMIRPSILPKAESARSTACCPKQRFEKSPANILTWEGVRDSILRSASWFRPSTTRLWFSGAFRRNSAIARPMPVAK